MKRILTVGMLMLILVACATNPLTGKMVQLQTDLQKLYPKTVGIVDADMNAIITSANADLASGKLQKLQYNQLIACPNAVLGLTGYIQQMIGTTIPPGAGAGWLLYEIKMQGADQVDQIITQVKLVKGSCEAMIPGLGVTF